MRHIKGPLWMAPPRQLGPDRRYTRALGATDGVVGEVPGCPGLTLDLSGLWAETDRLADSEDDPRAAG